MYSERRGLQEEGRYVYRPSDSTTGRVPSLSGGYFPPFILEDLSRIVCSFTESGSCAEGRIAETGSGRVDVVFLVFIPRLRVSAREIRFWQIERHRDFRTASDDGFDITER